MKTDSMMIRKDGDKEGLFFEGEVSGFGRHIYPNNYMYEGQFVKGVKEGYGRYIYPAGYHYVGFWKNDCRHGQGQFVSENGTTT